MIPTEATEKRCSDKKKIRTATLLAFLSCAQLPLIMLKREKVNVEDERGAYLSLPRASQKSKIESTLVVSRSSA